MASSRSKPAPAKPQAASAQQGHAGPMTLSIDIGGTGLKASVLDATGAMVAPRAWVATPYPCPPPVMLESLVTLVRPLPAFDRISAGFPGAVRDGKVITAPHYDTELWSGYDLQSALATALQRPARVANDAEVQGLGVISGQGLEMILTLGTGAGTGIFRDGSIAPHLELAHHPVHKDKTYNDYVGRDALKKAGKKHWNKRVLRVIGILEALVHYDMLYIGGGNAVHLSHGLPERTRVVSNEAGITGGIRLWQ
jgi:polyphosphate glucokinase